MQPDLVCKETDLAENINQAFISVAKAYSPLTDCVRVAMDDDQPFSVTEKSVARKLYAISSSLA